MTENVPVHRIADYACPALPWPFRAFDRIPESWARRWFPLEPEGLRETARRSTGLLDFGDERFREPYQVLLTALDHEAALSPAGRFMSRQLVLQLLRNRLRLESLVARHPEILDQPIRAPIVVVGLPRTGTTHLHNLLSQDAALRSLPYWEALEPIPSDERAPDEAGRRKRCGRAVRALHWAMPLFPLMHEMETEARHEEVQLLALSFSTMLFEGSYPIPSYRDWYLKNDQRPAYRDLKRTLQALQWLRGGDRWVLKSPQHLEQLGPLLEVFPDARIVQTHRDPVRVTASFATLGAYALRMNCGGIDARRVGHYWSDRIERMLEASIRDRPRVPPDQVIDCRFDEFMADPIAMAERIYRFAGQPWTPEVRGALERYQAAHGRGRLGRVEYRLEDFGLDPAERRRALAHYQAFFEVPDDPGGA